MTIREQLFTLADPSYKDFSARLTPTVSPDAVIGVRVPQVRKYAKEIKGTDEAADFLETLPHRYYEENNLHAFLIEQEKDYDKTVALLERFLPYVDNWATCDSMRPKAFAKNLDRAHTDALRWMQSGHIYTRRFGIEILMNSFLDEHFDPSDLDAVAACEGPEQDYYVNMMAAWYFATSLAKQYEKTLPILKQKKLSPWTNNKTIQKARESYRITKEQKEYLSSLKI